MNIYKKYGVYNIYIYYIHHTSYNLSLEAFRKYSLSPGQHHDNIMLWSILCMWALVTVLIYAAITNLVPVPETPEMNAAIAAGILFLLRIAMAVLVYTSRLTGRHWLLGNDDDRKPSRWQNFITILGFTILCGLLGWSGAPRAGELCIVIILYILLRFLHNRWAASTTPFEWRDGIQARANLFCTTTMVTSTLFPCYVFALLLDSIVQESSLPGEWSMPTNKFMGALVLLIVLHIWPTASRHIDRVRVSSDKKMYTRLQKRIGNWVQSYEVSTNVSRLEDTLRKFITVDFDCKYRLYGAQCYKQQDPPDDALQKIKMRGKCGGGRDVCTHQIVKQMLEPQNYDDKPEERILLTLPKDRATHRANTLLALLDITFGSWVDPLISTFMDPLHNKPYLTVLDAHTAFAYVKNEAGTHVNNNTGVFDKLFRYATGIVPSNGPEYTLAAEKASIMARITNTKLQEILLPDKRMPPGSKNKDNNQVDWIIASLVTALQTNK